MFFSNKYKFVFGPKFRNKQNHFDILDTLYIHLYDSHMCHYKFGIIWLSIVRDMPYISPGFAVKTGEIVYMNSPVCIHLWWVGVDVYKQRRA